MFMKELHPLSTVDERLGQLTGAAVFSKLDTNSCFWQIPLDTESRLLTTFITNFCCYCFNKLPFGISSALSEANVKYSLCVGGCALLN